MKTTGILSLIFSLFFAQTFAQNNLSVTPTSSEISDNLDLRAVASLFGDSKDLADFEYRLNDPKTQISNLDLNNDNQVDYLRVVESIEKNVHIVVIQAVLGQNQYQDVATIEIEPSNNNQAQIQVVGNSYLYGANYIYEPVYVSTPLLCSYFWTPNYRPYFSNWYWGYYPAYYYAWSPYPIFRYRYHIGLCINFNYQYHYVNFRICGWAYALYYGRRGNYCEMMFPMRAFEYRNRGFSNRYELDQTRPRHDVAYGDINTTMNQGPRNFDNPRTNSFNTPRHSDEGLYHENPRNFYNTSNQAIHDTPRSTYINNPRNSDNNPPIYNTPRPSYNFNPRPSTYNNTPRNTPNINSSPRGERSNLNNGSVRTNFERIGGSRGSFGGRR
ncbi:hypothetical protein [Flavobacterium aciduliphilum]|uniref:Uncharacterized protein n=1 Tax=Flavobacterium aciduliphilum TaxID=1101402 RepID=A0A328Y8Z9_9FLAO|nr:hypothetical protein [Flavobacterium aciduliphilum]RAR70080.1 hypothetical protein CLV55_11369 [Flavobacterium aciduliphilum]